MKIYNTENVTYPILRRAFLTADSMAVVLNRKKGYIFNRLRKPDKYSFTANDQKLLLEAMGMADTEENRKKVFEGN